MERTEKISKYLTYGECIKSQTAKRLGIDNTPNAAQIENMRFVGAEIFDPVREHIGHALSPSSFFRCIALNEAIGGSDSSQHINGEAVDIDSEIEGENKKIFEFIKDNLAFDQLILEYPDKDGNPSWVHASKTRRYNRGQILVKLKNRYIPFGEWRVGMV